MDLKCLIKKEKVLICIVKKQNYSNCTAHTPWVWLSDTYTLGMFGHIRIGYVIKIVVTQPLYWWIECSYRDYLLLATYNMGDNV